MRSLLPLNTKNLHCRTSSVSGDIFLTKVIVGEFRSLALEMIIASHTYHSFYIEPAFNQENAQNRSKTAGGVPSPVIKSVRPEGNPISPFFSDGDLWLNTGVTTESRFAAEGQW